MLAIESKSLTKIYAEGKSRVTAVDNLDLEISKGEMIGLFGPSGSGKTTLLSMLGCILQPTSGSYLLHGNEIVGLPESCLPQIRRKYISFIFQGFNLFPALTVVENVMLVLKLKGVRPAVARKKAQQLLFAVGLDKRQTFLPRDLSGGQKQRVAVARALAVDSPLILADEPTGNLDYENGRTVMDLLKTLAVEQQRTVVVATHDGRLEKVFDRIIVMEDGKMKREDRAL